MACTPLPPAAGMASHQDSVILQSTKTQHNREGGGQTLCGSNFVWAYRITKFKITHKKKHTQPLEEKEGGSRRRE